MIHQIHHKCKKRNSSESIGLGILFKERLSSDDPTRDMMDDVSRVGAGLGFLHLDLSSDSGSGVGMECEPEPI